MLSRLITLGACLLPSWGAHALASSADLPVITLPWGKWQAEVDKTDPEVSGYDKLQRYKSAFSLYLVETSFMFSAMFGSVQSRSDSVRQNSQSGTMIRYRALGASAVFPSTSRDCQSLQEAASHSRIRKASRFRKTRTASSSTSTSLCVPLSRMPGSYR